MNMSFLVKDLSTLCKKHKVFFSGKLRVSEGKKSQTIEHMEIDYIGQTRDTAGPFLKFQNEEFSTDAPHPVFKIKTVIRDADILLRDGVKSPVTQEVFRNRKDWNNHLKANGCVEIGNDFNNATGKKPLDGDFNCRKELTEAVNRVLK